MAQIYGQLQNAQLENLGTDPTTSVAGRFYLNTATGTVVVDDGTAKRALLRNDGKAVFGTDATAANNIRFHHAGVGLLQFVPGNDTTAENTSAATLAQVGFRAANLAAAPAVGNVGRIYYNTATNGLQVDNGTVFLQFATLTGTETLTNKTLSGPVVDVFSVSDQSATPATPAAGSTKFYSKAGSFYKIASDGLETLIGSGAGGSGSYNYLTNGDFESGVTTVQYASTALTNGLPSGTGPTLSNTANSITITSETTAPLRRTKSLRATAATAWSAGQGFSVGPAFTVQPSDLGKILNVTLTYQVVSGNTTLGYTGLPGTQSLAIAIYDVTAGAWLPAPAGSLGFATGSGSQPVTATFQSSVVSGQQYQVFVLNLVASTAAVTVLFDDISVSPNVANSADSRSITFQGTQANTTPGSGVNIPMTALLDRAGAWNGSAYVVPVAGDYIGIISGQIFAASSYFLAFNNGTALGNGFSSWAPGSANAGNGSFLFPNCKVGDLLSFRPNNSGVQVNCNASIVRIGGQSGNTNDARIVSFSGQVAASTAMTANTTILPLTPVKDSHGGYIAGTGYVIPVTGDYDISATMRNSAAFNLVAYVNGVVKAYVGSNANNSRTAFATTLVNLQAGQILTLRSDVTMTITADNGLDFVNISRKTGPSSVAASESVNATYSFSAGTSVGANAVLPFNNRLKDTHNSFLNGVFTCPVSGQYRLSVIAQTGTSCYIFVKKNGTGYSYIAQSIANQFGSGSISIPCVAGDTLAMYSDTAVTFGAPNANGILTQATIERTGN